MGSGLQKSPTTHIETAACCGRFFGVPGMGMI